MKHIIEKIKSAVQTNPAHFYSDSVEPILDTLYWHYCEDVGIDSPESKTAKSNFNAALESLPIDLINRIYTLAVTMNAEETRVAFHAGVKLGVQLMMEVQRKNS